MHTEHPLSDQALTASRSRTLEDKLLKFIEGHNPHIWTAIACVAVVVVWTR